MKTYVRYKDDGSLGICGQACSITNPWDKLHIFENYDEARKFMKNIENFKSHRENPRIDYYWQENLRQLGGGDVIRHLKGDQD